MTTLAGKQASKQASKQTNNQEARKQTRTLHQPCARTQSRGCALAQASRQASRQAGKQSGKQASKQASKHANIQRARRQARTLHHNSRNLGARTQQLNIERRALRAALHCCGTSLETAQAPATPPNLARIATEVPATPVRGPQGNACALGAAMPCAPMLRTQACACHAEKRYLRAASASQHALGKQRRKPRPPLTLKKEITWRDSNAEHTGGYEVHASFVPTIPP